jgi:hypothetical protein
LRPARLVCVGVQEAAQIAVLPHIDIGGESPG